MEDPLNTKPSADRHVSPTVIFCENYGTIPITLYLLSRENRTNPIVLMIPVNHDLYLFFEYVNKFVFNNSIKIVYQKPFTTQRALVTGLKKLVYILPDIFGERRYLERIFKQNFNKMKDCQIYFFSRAYSGKSYYLLKKLSKKNSLNYVSFQPADPSYQLSEYKPKNLTDLAILVINKLIYGRDIGIGQFPKENPLVKGFVYIPDKFIDKTVSSIITPEKRSMMMKDFNLDQFKIFNASQYRVIYFDDGLVGNEYPGYNFNKDTFKKEIGEILHIVTKYFPEKEIAYKYHPGYNGDRTLINTGVALPEYIPAEFLRHKNVLMYLSIVSSSIFNVENSTAVSIIDMITFPNNEVKQRYKEYLSSVSHTKILFPQSLEEFEEIVANISKLK